MYEILLEKSAQKELKALPVEIFRDIIELIKALGGNPGPSGCRKLAEPRQFWRIRYRKYRILYVIDDSKKEVRIMRVRHRREAYRW